MTCPSPSIHCGKKRGQTGRTCELNKRLSEFTRASSCALKTAAAACRFSTAWFHSDSIGIKTFAFLQLAFEIWGGLVERLFANLLVVRERLRCL